MEQEQCLQLGEDGGIFLCGGMRKFLAGGLGDSPHPPPVGRTLQSGIKHYGIILAASTV